MSKAKVSSFAATPGDLRQIVLDYLCDNCYIDTAQVLARDSSTRELDKDGDEVLMNGEGGVLDPQVVRVVRLRKEIKTRLLAGRIGDATDMLNLHFPAVLAPTADAPRHDPSHLFLNLRIQNFIEKSRTMPLPWPPGILLYSNPPTQNSSPAPKFSSLDDRPSLQDESREDEERKNRLLNLMNELYTLIHALSTPKDRATYHTELSAVGGLLAYPVPEKSREMRRYLDMGTREAVADQINEAILFRTKVALPSVLELIARHTTLLFSTLNSLSHPLPPPDQRPPGAEPFLSGVSATPPQDAKDQKGTKEIDVRELVPKFELGRLLGSDA